MAALWTPEASDSRAEFDVTHTQCPGLLVSQLKSLNLKTESSWFGMGPGAWLTERVLFQGLAPMF